MLNKCTWCFFALWALYLSALVAADPPAKQQDALKDLAAAFTALVGLGWDTSDASTACNPWYGITCDGSHNVIGLCVMRTYNGAFSG